MKYGRWTLIQYHFRSSLCRCECGKERYVRSCHLKNGTSKSCGCYRKDFFAAVGRGLKPTADDRKQILTRIYRPVENQKAQEDSQPLYHQRNVQSDGSKRVG